MAEPFDSSEYKVAAFLPQLTLDTYITVTISAKTVLSAARTSTPSQ
jgi:hypothetical protein